MSGADDQQDVDELVRNFCVRYRDAWNAHDADAVLALAGADVEWIDPTIPGGAARGHANVRRWLASFWRSFPDMIFDPIDGPHGDALDGAYLTRDRRRLAVPWRCTGTMRGPIDPPGFAPTHRAVALTGVDLYEFDDGKLSRVRTITDLQSAAEQLGLMPPRNGRAAKVLLGLQRIAARFTPRRARSE